MSNGQKMLNVIKLNNWTREGAKKTKKLDTMILKHKDVNFGVTYESSKLVKNIYHEYFEDFFFFPQRQMMKSQVTGVTVKT